MEIFHLKSQSKIRSANFFPVPQTRRQVSAHGFKPLQSQTYSKVTVLPTPSFRHVYDCPAQSLLFESLIEHQDEIILSICTNNNYLSVRDRELTIILFYISVHE